MQEAWQSKVLEPYRGLSRPESVGREKGGHRVARKVHTAGGIRESDRAPAILYPELLSPSSTAPFPHPAPGLKRASDRI